MSIKWSGGKVESLYIPSMNLRRRNKGDLPTPHVILVAIAFAGMVGAMLGAVAGWIYVAFMF